MRCIRKNRLTGGQAQGHTLPSLRDGYPLISRIVSALPGGFVSVSVAVFPTSSPRVPGNAEMRLRVSIYPSSGRRRRASCVPGEFPQVFFGSGAMKECIVSFRGLYVFPAGKQEGKTTVPEDGPERAEQAADAARVIHTGRDPAGEKTGSLLQFFPEPRIRAIAARSEDRAAFRGSAPWPDRSRTGSLRSRSRVPRCPSRYIPPGCRGTAAPRRSGPTPPF